MGRRRLPLALTDAGFDAADTGPQIATVAQRSHGVGLAFVATPIIPREPRAMTVSDS